MVFHYLKQGDPIFRTLFIIFAKMHYRFRSSLVHLTILFLSQCIKVILKFHTLHGIIVFYVLMILLLFIVIMLYM